MVQNQFDIVCGRNSAPKRSAGNRVERRMVSFSRAMVGKRLPVFHYGKHIKNGIVVHKNICLRNFIYAGTVLAKILDNLEIDGYVHYAEYLEPLTPEQVKARDNEFVNVNLEKYKTISHYNASSYFIQFKQCLKPDQCDFCDKKNTNHIYRK